MKPLLYDDIVRLSQEIAAASAAENEEMREAALKNLQRLCQINQGTPRDHSLQWEALADFTIDGEQAMDIYQIALETAEQMKLADDCASICLAMAQRYHEFEELDQALEFTIKANEIAKEITSEELKTEISEFLVTLNKMTITDSE